MPASVNTWLVVVPVPVVPSPKSQLHDVGPPVDESLNWTAWPTLWKRPWTCRPFTACLACVRVHSQVIACCKKPFPSDAAQAIKAAAQRIWPGTERTLRPSGGKVFLSVNIYYSPGRSVRKCFRAPHAGTGRLLLTILEPHCRRVRNLPCGTARIREHKA